MNATSSYLNRESRSLEQVLRERALRDPRHLVEWARVAWKGVRWPEKEEGKT